MCVVPSGIPSVQKNARAVGTKVFVEERNGDHREISTIGQAQWLTPVTPEFWEAKVDGSPEVRSLRPAWPT